jgi:ABC-type branched-subunit amino acid transport system permease subunit
MTAPALLLATSGVAALLALVLSFVSDGRLARRLAIASLWLALAAVPCSIAWDVVFPPPDAVHASSKATMLGVAISHVMSYGAVIVPFAGIAMIALRRASIAEGKRRRRA